MTHQRSLDCYDTSVVSLALLLLSSIASHPEVVHVQPIDLEDPVAFRTAGGSVLARACYLVYVRVDSPSAFFPRGSMPPAFIYGGVAGDTMITPLVDGVARVLVPRSTRASSSGGTHDPTSIALHFDPPTVDGPVVHLKNRSHLLAELLESLTACGTRFAYVERPDSE